MIDETAAAGETAETAPTKRVAIFGTTPSRMEGPTKGEDGWERWTIGPGGKDEHDWEKLFEIHQTWPDDFAEYLDDLCKVEKPREVWSLIPIPGKPKSNVIYPRKELFQKFPSRMWFSSSISYCMALAIDQQFTDISLWGIDLESSEEYRAQFFGCKFFMDVARLSGINVHVPPGCGLLRDPAPYPDRYETDFALTTERKMVWLEGMTKKLEGEFEHNNNLLQRMIGKLDYMKSIGADAKDLEKAENDVITHNIAIGQLAANVNQLKGELEATRFWRKMFVYETRDPG